MSFWGLRSYHILNNTLNVQLIFSYFLEVDSLFLSVVLLYILHWTWIKTHTDLSQKCFTSTVCMQITNSCSGMFLDCRKLYINLWTLQPYSKWVRWKWSHTFQSWWNKLLKGRKSFSTCLVCFRKYFTVMKNV